MLASDIKIDIVHVCTPPYVHAEIAINSMNAGKNVLVEKPMATCLEECDAMLEAEKKIMLSGMYCSESLPQFYYKLKKVVMIVVLLENPLCSCGFFVVERSLLL